MIRLILFSLVIASGSLLLASCATLNDQVNGEKVVEKPVVEPAGWAEEKKQRQRLKTWEIRGRLGVQTATNGGSMDIIWKQWNDEFSIRLIAPMGAGNHLIQGNSQFAEVQFPNGQKKTLHNIDNVLSSVLDIELPVSAVKDWIRGLPASSLSIEKISWNKQGLPERIKQSGWNVEMKNYLGSKILLPHAIYVSRDDDEKLDIRLALRQWLIDN